MRNKTLSDRLMLVVGMVKQGHRVADIGCDHAYASIYLIEQGIASKCIACDVKQGPLSHAEINIRKRGLDDRIETRLASGLHAITPGEIDVFLMAGMGGTLICRLIEDDIEIALSADEWILEPQSDAFLVRKLLHKYDYEIIEEDMICEENKYYPVIHAIRREKEKTVEMSLQDSYLQNSDLSDAELPEEVAQEVYDRFGKLLLEKKHPVLKEYLELGTRHYTEVIEELNNKDERSPRILERISEMKYELELVKTALKYYWN